MRMIRGNDLFFVAVYRKNRNSIDQRKEAEQADRTSPTSRLTDHYIALLVLIFTNAGLLDVCLINKSVSTSDDHA